MIRILPKVHTDISFNDNIQGSLVKALFGSLSSEDQHELINFRKLMAEHNSFYDGILQRDAFECLSHLIETLHEGTKINLLGIPFELVDDSFITSLAKNMFTCTIKKKLKCSLCNNETVSYMQTQFIYLYPKYTPSTVTQLLEQSFNGQVTRMCGACSEDTEHVEVSVLEHCSDVLVLVINRFDFGSYTRKNKTAITLERKLNHHFRNYELIGSVHHHGDSTASGHYTSKIYYTYVVYNCNDHIITELVPSDDNSDSVYMAFYRYCDRP